MHWHTLDHLSQLTLIDEESVNLPVLIFKHSPRCSISDIALRRLMNPPAESATHWKGYYLDLIHHPELSNEVSIRYKVHHESPQVLFIKDGECFFDCSHLDIHQEELQEQLEKLSLEYRTS